MLDCLPGLRPAIYALGLALSGAATAQDLDLSVTDPDELAAICGGDVNAGEPLFVANCSACHTIGPERENGEGPHLHEMFGRVAGTVEGFDYSEAMIAAGETGMFWERETLHAWLQDPQAHVPGTTTGMEPLTSELARNDLLTYLRINTLPPPPEPGTLVLPPEVLAIEGDRAYGEYLAQGCVGCHLASGDAAGGVPAITGLPNEVFVTAMHEYRLRARSNQVMQAQASNLSDEEIAALSAYFGDLD